MIVETPQILWNQEDDKGLPAALNSVSMCESGVVDNNVNEPTHVLATAGNSNQVNLWKISFLDDSKNQDASKTIFRKPVVSSGNHQGVMNVCTSTKIEYLCSLSRHEGPVNTVQFSPDGLHLATAGETGSVIVWSVPIHKRANGNGRHFWSQVTQDCDLLVRIVARAADGVCDLSWSDDSKRFMAGTIDHAIFICEDESYDANLQNPSNQQVPSEWRIIHRNGMEHTHYVQGVSYDPSGVYLASMSSDRSVRIFSRKQPGRKQKKVLRPSNAGTSPLPPPQHSAMVQELLTNSKIELSHKAKQLKYRKTVMDADTGAVSKQLLYTDESTLESFVRRLAWTPDGAFLITPAAIWHDDASDKKSSVQYATLLFARHRFDEPYRVLAGHEKPSIAVRPNHIKFQLPKSDAGKENESPEDSPIVVVGNSGNLPYRTVFAVLTWDSVLIYDTYHSKPLSIVRGIHYANLRDATWSSDGHSLFVCSTDGYISIIRFQEGELGEVYVPPPMPSPVQTSSSVSSKEDNSSATSVTPEAGSGIRIQPQPSYLPPCEPGRADVVEGPPTKKAKKTRITPTLISVANDNGQTLKRPVDEAVATVAVDKLSLESSSNNRKSDEELTHHSKKQKKRIQPTLLMSSLN